MVNVNFDNHSQFIGKKVEVEICCYEGGICIPENNVLQGMDEKFFYFISEQGTVDEQKWQFIYNEEKQGKLNCSIEVYVNHTRSQ